MESAHREVTLDEICILFRFPVGKNPSADRSAAEQ